MKKTTLIALCLVGLSSYSFATNNDAYDYQIKVTNSMVIDGKEQSNLPVTFSNPYVANRDVTVQPGAEKTQIINVTGGDGKSFVMKPDASASSLGNFCITPLGNELDFTKFLGFGCRSFQVHIWLEKIQGGFQYGCMAMPD